MHHCTARRGALLPMPWKTKLSRGQDSTRLKYEPIRVALVPILKGVLSTYRISKRTGLSLLIYTRRAAALKPRLVHCSLRFKRTVWKNGMKVTRKNLHAEKKHHGL
jgi:hypothetical protein